MTDYPADAPLDVRVRFHSGHLDVDASGTGTARATVEALDPSDRHSVEIARSARIDLTGQRLTVDIPGKWRRTSHVRVQLLVPAGSTVESQSGDVVLTTTGELADVKVRTGSGEVTVPTARDVDVKGGTTSVVIGTAARITVAAGRATLRAHHAADVSLKTGHGQAELQTTTGQVVVKGGGVALDLREAGSGEVHFETGAGSARVGVAAGTTVQVDLTSGMGEVRCDLALESVAPKGGAALRLRLRTGSGDVVVSKAAS